MNQRIKKLRKALDLTQKDFAGRIGMKQNSIALIETGKRNISDQAVLSICREFDVNETWLRTGDGEMFVEITPDEEIADFIGDLLSEEEDNFKKRFVSMLARLTPTEWKLIESKARELAEGTKKD